MDLRDHMMAKAPYMLGEKEAPEEGSIDFAALDLAAGLKEHPGHGVAESGYERIHGSGPEQAARPLVGTLEQGGVIDPTCCGRAPPVARASTSARSTSSTSTTSWTCAGIR